MSEYETIRYKRNHFQTKLVKALRTEKLIIGCFASWRTGKTDCLGLEHVIRRQLYDNADCLHLIAANTYTQLLDSTLRGLFEKLQLLGIPSVPEKLPRSGRPFSLQIWNGEKWVEFLCRSMDNFDIVSGVTLGSVWLDEVWATEKWTLDLAKSRLSDRKSKHLQLVISSTKDEPDHWMYTDIVEPYEQNRDLDGRSARDLIEIVEGTTYDNKQNLSDGYIELQRSTLEPRLIERFIENKWVSTVTGRAYPYLDGDIHIRPFTFNSSLPVILCLDFNVDPGVWEMGQDKYPIEQENGKFTEGTIFFDEIWQRATDIWKMCAEAKIRLTKLCGDEERARKHKIIFYGDYQHGTGRGQNATASSWEIVQTQFRDWNAEYRRRSNPRIVDRVNATNSRMRSSDGRVRLAYSINCIQLKKDHEIVTYEDLRNYANQGDRTHACSAIDYMVNYEYPVLPRGGRLTE